MMMMMMREGERGRERERERVELQGCIQDFREGGADVRTCEFWPHPFTKWKGRSSDYHKELILSIASELESRFSTEFWDKISFWLTSKLFFL